MESSPSQILLIPTSNSTTIPHEGRFTTQEIQQVRNKLLLWYQQHRRRLPWRGDTLPYTTTEDVIISTKNEFHHHSSLHQNANDQTNTKFTTTTTTTTPYSSWVSEIMCQQTRVATVIKYHAAWLHKFPTIQDLAIATEDDVNKQWAGLGYYRRARLLHQGAKHVVECYGGQLPHDVKTLLTIPGIGPYTAGAISSIAFNQYEPGKREKGIKREGPRREMIDEYVLFLLTSSFSPPLFHLLDTGKNTG